MTAPLMYEPRDPADPVTIPIDADTFNRIAQKHGLEPGRDENAGCAYLVLDGIEFVAALELTAARSA